MARVEIITGPERRRRWSAEQKRAIVAESLAPGAVVTEIARRMDICPGQIYRLAAAAGERQWFRPGCDRAGRG
jgi:transposase